MDLRTHRTPYWGHDVCGSARRSPLVYRYRRQRHTTLMVRVKHSFLHHILWPEYVELRDALDEYLAAATDRIIREEVFNDAREAQEQPD